MAALSAQSTIRRDGQFATAAEKVKVINPEIDRKILAGTRPAPKAGMMARITEAEDWRLRGQEKWLSGAKVRWRAWWPYRAGWDHDQCEFCWAKFSDTGAEGTLREGYVTDDNYRWICRDCFEHFRERFRWLVI